MTELEPDVLADFRKTSTATVSGRLFRRGLRNVLLRGVKPLAAYDAPMVGPAYTLRYIPAREDLDGFGIKPDSNETQREAFEQTPAGHVLVMDCREETRAACCGDILVTRLMVRGGAGIVTDGGVRDSAPISRMAIPVFCAAPSPPVNRVVHHALEHGRPIACGGVAVYPGDIVLGDADGVVIVPRAIAAEIAREAVEQEEMEAWLAERVRAGAPLAGTFPPSEETLKEYKAWRSRQTGS
ncbi:MAG TPA: ribonuclease activity regulator RraA [Xanthobacteraceae bacterium]